MKVLVIQGAGMNMRGKAQLEIFGPTTLEQINAAIEQYARGLEIDVEILQTNIEGEAVNALYEAHERKVDAGIINPAGYSHTSGPLPNAIAQVSFPVVEVHMSNPVARGPVSTILPVCKGSVTGFGVYGYYLALAGLKELAR